MSVAPFVQPCPFIPTSEAPSVQPSRHQSSPVHAGTLAQQPPQSTKRAAPFVQLGPGIPISAALSVQPSRRQSSSVHAQQLPQSTMSAAPFVQPRPGIHTRNGDTHRFSHDELIGKEVILYANMKTAQPVAKGIVISTNPSTVLGGQALGKQFREVVIKVVVKRDAMLPCPYVGVETTMQSSCQLHGHIIG